MNMNKVYFYIALCAIIIGSIWINIPRAQQRAQMKHTAQKCKASQTAAQNNHTASQAAPTTAACTTPSSHKE